MRTASIFTNGSNQAVRIPKDMEFQGIDELEITKEGDILILRPVRPSWLSLNDIEPSDDNFLQDRPPVIDDEGRFAWL